MPRRLENSQSTETIPLKKKDASHSRRRDGGHSTVKVTVVSPHLGQQLAWRYAKALLQWLGSRPRSFVGAGVLCEGDPRMPHL